MFISIQNPSNVHSDFMAEVMILRFYRDRKRMAQPGTETAGGGRI